jgi:hypothetical protein
MSSPTYSRLNASGQRIYTWPATQESFASVTTILEAGIPKPALQYWAAKLVAERAVSNIDDLLKEIKATSPEKAVALLKSAPTDYTRERSRIGTMTHSAIEDYVRFNRRPITQSPIVESALDKFEHFMEDWKPKFLYTETTVYSRSHGYAGTFDDIIEINGVPIILDVKSGKNVWAEAAMQMSAYRRADFIGLDGDKEVKLPDIQGGAVLHISPDVEDYKFIPMYVGDEVFQQFLRAVDTYNFLNRTAKEIRLVFRHLTPKKAAKLNGNSPKWVKDIFRDKLLP